MGSRWSVAFAACAFVGLVVSSARAEIVDAVVAVVGGAAPAPGVDTVVLSDVEFRARHRRLQRLDVGDVRAVLAAAIDADERRAALDAIVGEVLIAREAERVRIAPASAADVARERARIVESAGGAERIGTLLVAPFGSEEELDGWARRRATVGQFLRANLEGASAVTERDVADAHAAGGHPFEGRPLEDIAPLLRAWLTQRAVERATSRWVATLRARTVVRFTRHAEEAPRAR